jgi:acetyl-CoA acetyltransferase family protein
MPQLGREALIIDAVRTPVGRGHAEKGQLRDLHPADLLGQTFVELIRRSGIDANEVDNVLAGCVYQIGEQGQGITRNAWLQKGLPETTGATTLDIRCGSGQQAVNLAALCIAGGVDDVVVAGGVEHMGRVGFRVNADSQKVYGSGISQELRDRFALVSQGEGAEMIADQWDISRTAMDEFAMQSHVRANAATVGGKFAREIFALTTPQGTILTDQGIRPDTTMESLAALNPAFRVEGGRVTAGNSSQISDGAAALLLSSREKATELGLHPRARIVDQVTLGVDPVTMLTGPIPATRRILSRNGMTLRDLDAIEINEAFASVVIAWERELNPDMTKVNARGGAIAIGHPLGSTGARLITTLLHELEDNDGQWGLVTMCCGGGLGTATLIERVSG